MLGVPANYYLEKGRHANDSANALANWTLDTVGVD
jgi:hypothetical protein